MKQITIILLAALTFGCTKQVTNKVNASSVNNLDSSKLPIVEFTATCYDGTNYNATVTAYGLQAGDSIFAGFTSPEGQINQEFITVVTQWTDIAEYSLTQTTELSNVNAYLIVAHASGWANIYNSPVITESCETPRISPELRKTLWQKLKDRMNNLRGN